MRVPSPALFGLLCLLPAAIAGAAEALPEGPGGGAPVAHTVVRVESRVAIEDVPVRMRADEAAFWNTGFFVSTDGEVLTSVLGLAGCCQVTVVGADGRRVNARVKAFDQPSGLALLATGLAGTVPFEGAVEQPRPGSPVLVASAGASGAGWAPVLFPGVVGERADPVRMHGLEWRELVPTSCAVRTGSAAAPVLNGEGRLVGVVLGSASAPAAEAVPAGCYVLPLAQLEPVLERMRQGESRRLGWLGVVVGDKRDGSPGVCVLEVMDGAPGARAGLRRGDILLEMDGRALEDPSVLTERVTQAGPGQQVSLLVKRGGGAARAVPATVGPRPLLICGGMGRPGGEVVRVRWRRSVGALRLPGRADGTEEVLFELFDENEELRGRVRALEEELAHLRARN